MIDPALALSVSEQSLLGVLLARRITTSA